MDIEKAEAMLLQYEENVGTNNDMNNVTTTHFHLFI